MIIIRRSIKILTLLFLLSSPNHSYASAQTSFSKGIDLFKSGHYSQAITHFKKAEQSGLKSASLYFNLGSSYYRAGHYQQSISYFEKLNKFPKMLDIAAYNLGLVYTKIGDEKLSQKWFNWIIKNSSNTKIIALSEQQINKSNAISSQKKWSNYASLSIGNDSNINVAPSGTALEKSDSFFKLYLNSEYLFSGSRAEGWLMSGGVYHKNFSDFSENNERQYNFAIKRKLNINDWKSHFKTKVTKSIYNDRSYQTVLSLQASTTKNLSSKNKLKLRYRYSDIKSDNNNYAYLDGNKQQLRAELRRKQKSYIQKFYYEYETNNRNDSATLSYSANRHTINAIHTIKHSNSIHWGGEFSYRQSSYPVINLNDRDATRWKYAIFADYNFDRTTKLKAKLTHTDNQSDSSIFDYNNNIAELTLSKIF